MTPREGGPARPGEPGASADDFDAHDDDDGFEEPVPEPVFVDQSGLRGRLLRGMGWPVSLVGAVLAVAMGGSLIGMQADAPALVVPAQPAQAPSAPAVPSPSPSAPAAPSPSPSPSATGTAGRSTAPGTKGPAGSTKPSGARSGSKSPTGVHASTPSGQSAAHS
ncbi:hypothetical protein [Kitasatospora phosalacinea]|uniref:hypothetical protein n=1 Tax=Kitasatospora phosalacinea TaxID=2065 RepID=UPI000523FCEB|nr:hypothetical protein [Kitasatospora phosalacinea]